MSAPSWVLPATKTASPSPIPGLCSSCLQDHWDRALSTRIAPAISFCRSWLHRPRFLLKYFTPSPARTTSAHSPWRPGAPRVLSAGSIIPPYAAPPPGGRRDLRRPSLQSPVEDHSNSVLVIFNAPAASGDYALSIFSVNGKRLYTSQIADHGAGTYSTVWNSGVHPGTYVAEVCSRSFSAEKRFIVK